MTAPALALAAANLLLIGVLPRVFFRPGELNAAWWLTAAPFILAGAGVCTVAAGLVQPLEPPAGVSGLAGAAALVLSSASIMLICYAAGTHPHPVSLWHQPRDTPVRLVTFGAYAHVRHPFYAAFLLALAACLLAAPSPVTALASVLGAVRLGRTARREEQRLLDAFGGEYASYMKRTGRFLPRF